MEKQSEYEKFTAKNIKSLKTPTIYYFLICNNFSENHITKLRKNPLAIKINGQFSNTRCKIEEGDEIEILKNVTPKTNIAFCTGDLDVLFEDEDYLIVNKPHNLSCMPSMSHFYDNLGGQICKYMDSKDKNFVLRIVNRLDRETSGIVVVAKNLLAYKGIQHINKEYHAVCCGDIKEKNFTINTPILTQQTNGINNMKRIVSPFGKPAVTHVEVLSKKNNLSLVKLKLETGRTHQIRVHLSSIGHSLLDDQLYSNNPAVWSKEKHCFLTLKKIQFVHFKTKEPIEIEIDYPNDWNDFV